MEFIEFRDELKKHFEKISKDQQVLFLTNVDKDELWNHYLDSFPPGTNEIFRERREYDCSSCKQFIRSFGNVVVIENNNIKTIWDFKVNNEKYQTVIDSLSNFIKSHSIQDVFITKDSIFGTESSREFTDSNVVRWHHFHIKLPKKFVTSSPKSVGDLMGNYRDIRNVFQRSLNEFTKESIETILDLINQKSLYKGEEWKGVLEKFLTIHKEYHKLPNNKKENYCWVKSIEVGGVIGKIRNHSIGTLLTDVSNEMDLNEAVKRYEKIVAPVNYKRPKAIFTKKMLEEARKTVQDLGLENALGRRYATINDITVNNILFANKDSHKKMTGDVFDDLEKDVSEKPKKFDKVEEISIEEFVENVIPTSKNIELLFENKHKSNLVSLIAPKDKNASPLFKWDNSFSWSYTGNITDSMKELVKKEGGKVDGVLRFSIQWNDNDDNQDDYDAHCIEPNKNHIWFESKGRRHPSTGMLDVDIIQPRSKTAVENITWTNINKMHEGKYHFYVHNYTHRGGTSGFTAEIEYDGQIFTFEYPNKLRNDEKVTVAKIKFSKQNGIEFIESLKSTESSKTFWNISTNKFHPVSVCMYSPNYWDGKHGIGNKHYFFILKDCKNDEQPNGFFNEFIKEDLMPHKKVFEALGSKMKVEESDEQLSGLGFSSTKRNSIICKVEGNFTRMLKITF